jgi:outer membrane protein
VDRFSLSSSAVAMVVIGFSPLAGAQPPAGGITADQVATRAAATSYQARAAEETASALAARTDAARVAFVPRIAVTGRYARLSSFTPPTLGEGSPVVTTAEPGTPTPPSVAGERLSFPIVLDQWLAQASVIVPISDYLLRLNQAVTAASRQEDAARFDAAAARARSAADGKIVYYGWLRARGGVGVAQQTLAIARAHAKDAERQAAAGTSSKADILRAQTAVAAAELGVERAKNAAAFSEAQVRIAVHGGDEERLEPGESLEGAVPAVARNLRTLVAEAQAARPEIKSIDRNAEAARKLASVARAGRLPVLSAFGDVLQANPNPRRFPQSPEWFPTWQVGAQITWSPSDLLTAGAGSADAEARAAALDAQREVVRDAVRLEVTQAFHQASEADASILTTTRQLESAEEGYRVARELFIVGRATATTLIDAETALAEARFAHLHARVDARLARVRLEHATGRDVK